MDNQAITYHITQEPTRKSGIANVKQTLDFAALRSRTTLLAWEREGKFPKRVSLGGGRVGWRWSELYRWADSLPAEEA